MTDESGTIYLVHFDRPFSHAKHYMGWTTDLDRRLESHGRGQGSALLRAVREAGIGWHLVRTWRGTRSEERLLKNRRNAPRLCPVCMGWVEPNDDDSPFLDGTEGI